MKRKQTTHSHEPSLESLIEEFVPEITMALVLITHDRQGWHVQFGDCTPGQGATLRQAFYKGRELYDMRGVNTHPKSRLKASVERAVELELMYQQEKRLRELSAPPFDRGPCTCDICQANRKAMP